MPENFFLYDPEVAAAVTKQGQLAMEKMLEQFTKKVWYVPVKTSDNRKISYRLVENSTLYNQIIDLYGEIPRSLELFLEDGPVSKLVDEQC